MSICRDILKTSRPQARKTGFMPRQRMVAGMPMLGKSTVARKMACLLAVAFLGLAGSRAQEREATPAVVNPVLRSPVRQTLSLDGAWDFATDPSGIGDQQRWFAPDTVLANKISLQVPGCWEAQGVGGETAVAQPDAARLRGSYTGTAWYRKELTLPKDWAGRQIWLKIGGVNAQGWFWANGTCLG